MHPLRITGARCGSPPFTWPGVTAPPCSRASRQLRAEVRTAVAVRPARHTRLGSKTSHKNFSDSTRKCLEGGEIKENGTREEQRKSFGGFWGKLLTLVCSYELATAPIFGCWECSCKAMAKIQRFSHKCSEQEVRHPTSVSFPSYSFIFPRWLRPPDILSHNTTVGAAQLCQLW